MSNYQHERGWLDSDVWGNAPYSEREAWSWMIGEANWCDSIKNINGHPIEIKRGQFTSSIRFMAIKFQWDKNKVSRYLQKLERWGMILCSKSGTESGTGQNIITICNYSTYQNKNGKSGTESDTKVGQRWDRSGTETGQTINPSNPSNQLYPPYNTPQHKKPVGAKNAQTGKKPDDVSEAIWTDFLAHRKAKKAPVTETVLKTIRREAEKIPWTLDQALAEICARGWQGFKAEWVMRDMGGAKISQNMKNLMEIAENGW